MSRSCKGNARPKLVPVSTLLLGEQFLGPRVMRPWSIHKLLPHLPCLIKPRLDLPFPTGSCATGSNLTQPALPCPFPTKRNATVLTLPNPTCHTYPRHPYRVKPALPHPNSPDHIMTQHSPPHLPKHNMPFRTLRKHALPKQILPLQDLPYLPNRNAPFRNATYPNSPAEPQRAYS